MTENTLLALLTQAISGHGETLDVFTKENFPDLVEEGDETGWDIHELIDALYSWRDKPPTTLNGAPITEIDHWGGEGQGDDYGYVYGYKDEFVRLTGHYTSYNGVYWDDTEPELVESREVVVTKWFAKDEA